MNDFGNSASAIHVKTASQAAFAVTVIALGILGLVKGDFTPVWQPGPATAPAHQILVYLCALVCLGCGLGLLVPRVAAIASRLLLIYLILWLLVIRLPEVLPAPTVVGSWFGCTETAVSVAGSWVLYTWFANAWDRRWLGFITADKGLRIARVLFGLALIHFGIAHFVYLPQTVVLIPRYLPQPAAWAYFTGSAYIAAGLAVLVGVCARLAAALAAVQMAGFTLLVWIPIVAAGSQGPVQISETILSWAMTTAAWVVADSYRGVPWLALDRR